MHDCSLPGLFKFTPASRDTKSLDRSVSSSGKGLSRLEGMLGDPAGMGALEVPPPRVKLKCL